MRRGIDRFETRHPRLRQPADDGFERVPFEPPALGTDLIIHKDSSQHRALVDKAAFSGRILRNVT
ncbi:hypothetical protein CP49_21945 [Bradyrhizobium valentinum]|uniref:Uncharacterized protein n=1 Tax=Bradyrhizobium valentinum TaxID=1518501 RepID=A0A0R3LS99_9BRAD|nr:hypothetical protein CP49_21945 [Bradyrhizobium valentinum]